MDAYIYPMSMMDACEAAAASKISLRTELTPSRYAGYFFTDGTEATYFRLAFDAYCWPIKSKEEFLLYLEPSEAVTAWIKEHGGTATPVEITAIQFQSEDDKASFESTVF